MNYRKVTAGITIFLVTGNAFTIFEKTAYTDKNGIEIYEQSVHQRTLIDTSSAIISAVHH